MSPYHAGMSRRLVLGAVLLAAMTVAGCGTKQPPTQVKQLVGSAGQALKGTAPKLEFPSTTDDAATVKATFDDGSELNWDVVKDGADWVLKACEATDRVAMTQDCVPTGRQEQPALNSPFTDCVLGLSNLPQFWSLCDPLVDPTTSASAVSTWNSCRAAGERPGPCAFRIQGTSGDTP